MSDTAQKDPTHHTGGWIGIDADACLFEWGPGTSNPWNVLIVGKPIPRMVELVKTLLAEGKTIKIFTARVGPASAEECLAAFSGRGKFPGYEGEIGPNPVRDWINYQTMILNEACMFAFGRTFEITATKDFHMWALYDDRAIQVIPNTGELLQDKYEAAVAHIAQIAELDVQADPTIAETLDLERQSQR